MIAETETLQVGNITFGPRDVRRVPRNETPSVKLYRLTVATVRAFAQEYPKEFAEIARQEILDKRK